MASTEHLLPDHPTTQDEFGAHSRVAMAIAELIRTERPGKAIAVIGPWGSGKSSVLRMVQGRLVDFADVFIFDAWTHEGDPLRRTFLATLIDFLWRDNRSAEIKNLQDEITLPKKTKEETTTPLLTVEAKTLGILLLLVPVGLAMFAAMVRMREPSGPLTIAALILTLLPLLFVAVLALGVGLRKAAVGALPLSRETAIGMTVALFVGLAIGLYRAWLFQLTKPQVILLLLPALVVVVLAISRSSTSSILPVLLNRTVTTTRSESFDSGEPSSVEFQRWFRSIVALHRKSKDTRLVIGIDNLDRVDSGLARQLWATMRIFFEVDVQPLEERIWLLAAFDEGAIRRLWGEADDPDSFIKKTFQASFFVPSLVLIHRDDYLKKQLRKAFPFCGDPLLDPVVRLYSLKNAGEISTPRSIISFVNSVGSIHRQWREDEIPLIHKALYVLAAENRTDIMTILTAVSTAAWSPEELIRANWQESLAAIHFNVPPQEVAHVFMPPAIIEGLLSGDVGKFSNLARIRGFGSVLSEVAIRNKEAWKQAKSLANAVLALDSLGGNESDDGVNRTWRILRAAASSIERWDLSPETGSALSILIRRSSNENDQITKLLKSAGRAIPRMGDNSVDNSDEGLTRFTRALAPVVDQLTRLPRSFQMIIYGSAQTYINLLNVINAMKPKELADIASHLDTEARGEIPRVLEADIKAVQLKENFHLVFGALYAHFKELDWQPVINSVEYLFGNTNNNFLQSGYKAALETLLVLASSDASAAKSLENLTRSGALYQYLALASETRAAAQDPQTRYLALLVLVLYSDGSDPNAWPGDARGGLSVFRRWLNNPDSIGVIAGLVLTFSQKARLHSRIGISDSMNKALGAVLRLLADRTEIS